MEQEILDELEKIYDNCKIEVEFVDFRLYKIKFEIHLLNGEHHIIYIYKWDINSTKNYNLSKICYNIDNEIKKIFKKEEYKYD